MPFRAIDLFCGCGGLSTGFFEEGFEIIASVEKNSVAVSTYARNFPQTQVFNQDIREINPFDLRRKLGLQRGELDCLIGGPPCQGFSKNVPATRRFLADPRNQLMEVFLSFVKEFRPKTVLIENVAEVVRAFDGQVSNEVLSELSIDYSAKVKVLNARDYGVPQIRRRAFFLASRVKEVDFPEPTHAGIKEGRKALVYDGYQSMLFDECQLYSLEKRQEPYVSVWDAISELPTLEHGAGENPCEYTSAPQTPYQHLIREKALLLHDHVARRLTPIQYQRISLLGEGQGMMDLPVELQAKKGYSGAYGRLIPNEPAKTITKWVFHPGSGRFAHPYDNRVITIREAARLQSFPDWFAFEGTYLQKSAQVGEAVPPLLVRKLAASLNTNLGG